MSRAGGIPVVHGREDVNGISGEIGLGRAEKPVWALYMLGAGNYTRKTGRAGEATSARSTP